MNHPYKILWWILFSGLFGFLLWTGHAQSNVTLVPVVTEVTNEYRWVGSATFLGTNYSLYMPFAFTNIRLAGVDVAPLKSSQGPMSTNRADMHWELASPGPPLPIK